MKQDLSLARSVSRDDSQMHLPHGKEFSHSSLSERRGHVGYASPQVEPLHANGASDDGVSCETDVVFEISQIYGAFLHAIRVSVDNSL